MAGSVPASRLRPPLTSSSPSPLPWKCQESDRCQAPLACVSHWPWAGAGAGCSSPPSSRRLPLAARPPCCPALAAALLCVCFCREGPGHLPSQGVSSPRLPAMGVSGQRVGCRSESPLGGPTAHSLPGHSVGWTVQPGPHSSGLRWVVERLRMSVRAWVWGPPGGDSRGRWAGGQGGLMSGHGNGGPRWGWGGGSLACARPGARLLVLVCCPPLTHLLLFPNLVFLFSPPVCLPPFLP